MSAVSIVLAVVTLSAPAVAKEPIDAQSVMRNYVPKSFCHSTRNRYGRLEGGGSLSMIDCMTVDEHGNKKVKMMLADSSEYSLGDGKYSCVWVRERIETAEGTRIEDYRFLFTRDGHGRKVGFDYGAIQCKLE